MDYDRWQDILYNSISSISGQCKGEYSETDKEGIWG